MDKVMKAEIKEIVRLAIKTKEQELATNAFTSLIIKWLEEKRGYLIDNLPLMNSANYLEGCEKARDLVDARNQLITELVEEMK